MNAILNGGRGGGINEVALRDSNKLRRVFDKIDLDGSGDIDREEFAKAARLCSMVITDQEIDSIFNKMRDSRSDTISFDRFSDGISSILAYSSTDDVSNLDKGVRLVLELFDKHMNGNKKAADLFTRKLLANKELRSLKNVDLDRQASMVFGMVSLAIRGLSDIDRLRKRLEKEGLRHFYVFKLTDKHYELVRKALFDTLPVVIGDDYTLFAQMQFEKYFKVIQDSMVKGYNNR